MPTLASELRNKLERVVVEARDVAEAGARAALEALAVHEAKHYPHMSKQQRQLRNHLRARARQLGDRQDRSGRLAIDHLVRECAYEHWHRMLFARFLAENGLLIEPQEDIAISLDEAKELAKEAGVDVWAFASRCAEQMLPQIFRPDDPLLQVSFATEHQIRLEGLLDSLPPAVFTASDALGWVYQFWQSKKKDQVNRLEVKIGADELPAVTQLFTEPYMVNFLIHNTLGAWWAGKRLTTQDARNAEAEEELRKKLALPGVEWEYLRFVRGEDGKGGPWRPAAGTFDGWPKAAKDIKVLDPCCGSGHFLVAALHHLVPIRMAEEDLSARDAVDAVLRDNLHGLEIDERCCQIAAFALAFAAWTYPDAGGYRELPELHIACTGIAVGSGVEDWVRLAGSDGKLAEGMRRLHRLFRDAPCLGSLIDPSVVAGDIFTATFSELRPLLDEAVARERADYLMNEVGVSAKGITKATAVLADRYHLIITNVPYLVRGKQADTLKEFCEDRCPEAKSDLATAMMKRCLQFTASSGTVAMVILQYWLFLTTYRKLRKQTLTTSVWQLVARLGEGAFDTISGAVVNVALMVMSNGTPNRDTVFSGLDADDAKGCTAKSAKIQTEPLVAMPQLKQLDNPDHRILLSDLSKHDRLGEYAIVSEGLHTGDYPRFGRKFWEVPAVGNGWALQQAAPGEVVPYGGREHILFWEDGEGQLIEYVQERLGGQSTTMWIKGDSVWGKTGVAVSAMSDLRATLYTGQLFTHGAIVIVPKKAKDLQAIWAYVSSPQFSENVRILDKKVCVARGSVENVSFDYEHWKKLGEGLPPVRDADCTDPTQWAFSGRVKEATRPLQVAVARLLGYEWPEQEDGLAGDYGDTDGIVCIPSVRGEEPAAERLRRLLAAAFSACASLSACRHAQANTADRGDAWSPQRERELIAATGSKETTLDGWLRNDFFQQHCQLFHHRPFIWHIWDGRKRDGFGALVNYHKLCGVEAASSRLNSDTRQDAASTSSGRNLLESLTYSYLGDWITRQKDGVKRGEAGAEDRLAAALELQKRLVAILEGEPPFDLFVRWKPLHEQPIGWEPDINDGVRINIRPFMASDLPNGRKGAGILRWKPNIKWKKDRGKEPHRPKDEYPWFWGWDETTMDFMGGSEFDGNRWNSLHYTNETKRKAREATKKESRR